MRRYPHSAILTIRLEPEFINGKRQLDKTATVSLAGRYDADGKTIKKNPNGDEIVIAGCFYIRKGQMPQVDGTVIGINVPSLGISEPVFDIQCWQSHIVISIAKSSRL